MAREILERIYVHQITLEITPTIIYKTKSCRSPASVTIICEEIGPFISSKSIAIPLQISELLHLATLYNYIL